MTTTKQNGPDSREVHPIKKPAKYAADFIANCTRFPSTSFGICVVLSMLLVKVALVAWEVL